MTENEVVKARGQQWGRESQIVKAVEQFAAAVKHPLPDGDQTIDDLLNRLAAAVAEIKGDGRRAMAQRVVASARAGSSVRRMK